MNWRKVLQSINWENLINIKVTIFPANIGLIYLCKDPLKPAYHRTIMIVINPKGKLRYLNQINLRILQLSVMDQGNFRVRLIWICIGKGISAEVADKILSVFNKYVQINLPPLFESSSQPESISKLNHSDNKNINRIRFYLQNILFIMSSKLVLNKTEQIFNFLTISMTIAGTVNYRVVGRLRHLFLYLPIGIDGDFEFNLSYVYVIINFI